MNQALSPAPATFHRPLTGILLTVCAMVLLAVSDAISKHLTSLAPLMMIVWTRYLIFFVVGSASAARHHGVSGFRSNRPGLQLARGLCLVTANITIIWGFSLLPLADVHAVLAVAPLMVTLAAVALLKERIGGDQWLAILCGFLGILIILRPGSSVFDPVALIPLLGAALFGLYQLMTRMLSRVDQQETTQFYTGATGFACFSVLAALTWQTPSAWVWGLLIIGGITNVTAHLMIIQSLHFAPASTLQPFHYTMFVSAVALGYLVFGELPDTATIAGAIIVIVSGLYSFAREQRQTKAPPTAD